MGRLGVLGRMPPKAGKGREEEFVWEMLPGSTGRERGWETGKAGRANDCAGYRHVTGNGCSISLPRYLELYYHSFMVSFLFFLSTSA